MAKKSSKKKWTELVKEKLFTSVVNKGDDEHKNKDSTVADTYFKGTWEQQDDGAKWAFFKSKYEEELGVSVDDKLDTVELTGSQIDDSEEKPEDIISITEIGRTSEDSRYTREPVLRDKQTSEALPTKQLLKKSTKTETVDGKTTPLPKKVSQDTQTTPLPKKVPEGEKKFKEESPLASITEKTSGIIEEGHKWDYFRRNTEKGTVYAKGSQKKTTPVAKETFAPVKQITPEPSKGDKQIQDTKKTIETVVQPPAQPSLPEPVQSNQAFPQPDPFSAQNTQFATQGSPFQSQQGGMTSSPFSSQGGMSPFSSQGDMSPFSSQSGMSPFSSQGGMSPFSSQGGMQDVSSLYPGVYSGDPSQMPMGQMPPDMGYGGYPPPDMGYPQGYPQGYPPMGYPPQGYPPMGYPPQGYPPMGYPPQGYPSQGYPPMGYPPQGYPQGYVPMQYPSGQIEIVMIQQILSYLLQSGIFSQLQSFLTHTNLPTEKNQKVIEEVVKKVIGEVKKQNPAGAITNDQENFIQDKLAGTIAALNPQKTMETPESNVMNTIENLINAPGTLTQELNAQKAPETSFLGSKGTTPLNLLSISRLTSELNLHQAPQTSPLGTPESNLTSLLSLAQASQTALLGTPESKFTSSLNLPQAPQTSPLNLMQAPHTAPLAMESKFTSSLNLPQAPQTSPLNLMQAPQTSPLAMESKFTSSLNLPQAPQTAPLIMPKANLEIFNDMQNEDWFSEEKTAEEEKAAKTEIEDTSQKKDIYSRILQSSNDTNQVEQEVDDWFKKKTLKKEEGVGDIEEKDIEKPSCASVTEGAVTTPLTMMKSKGTAPLILPEQKKTDTSVTEGAVTAPLTMMKSKGTAPLILPAEQKSPILPDREIAEKISDNWEDDLLFSMDWDPMETDGEAKQIIDNIDWMESEVVKDTGTENIPQKTKSAITDASKKSLPEKKDISSTETEKTPDLLQTLAKCEMLLNAKPSQPKKALTLCKTLLAAFPGNPLVYHMASEAYDKLGKKEKALKYQKKANMIEFE